MHQANQNLIVEVAPALEVAPEKFYSNIARYGNTSSASMLIAASEWMESAGFRRRSPRGIRRRSALDFTGARYSR